MVERTRADATMTTRLTWRCVMTTHTAALASPKRPSNTCEWATSSLFSTTRKCQPTWSSSVQMQAQPSSTLSVLTERPFCLKDTQLAKTLQQAICSLPREWLCTRSTTRSFTTSTVFSPWKTSHFKKLRIAISACEEVSWETLSL